MTAPNCTTKCIFCTLPDSRIIRANKHAIIIRDGFPISPGHTLIIPRRHVGSFFQITAEERTCLLELLDQSKKMVDEEFNPDGYNIGINDGVSAGQTVPHLHIHLIPRYSGDREDPRGGVRWIIPEKADYWSEK
jgi:diadenosine tetraphosphate (Ap4A) HIT family hydrolase